MKFIENMWQKNIDYSDLPFTAVDDNSWPTLRLKISKDIALPEGSLKVAEEILHTSDDLLHWELAESLAQGLRFSYEDDRDLFYPPAYNVEAWGSSTIRLELLPNFKRPSTIVWCYLSNDNVFRVGFMEYSLDPRLGPINVGKFRAEYQIPNEDLLSIRNTCVDILHARNALTPSSSRTGFLKHGFKHASGRNEAVYASLDRKIVWET